jgi:uncharacterized membrane protein
VRIPFSPSYFFFLLIVISALMGVIQFGIVTLTLNKLGLSVAQAFLLLVSSLFGSLINIPLFKIDAETPPDYIVAHRFGLFRPIQIEFTGQTIIAVNIGGAVIPVLFSFYLLSHTGLGVIQVIMAIGVVTAISYFMSRPIMGFGIGMPILIAPLTAATVALLINAELSPPLAYISGTMGVLIGADLLHLKDVRKFGTPLASIGGAGTFDGIFITGLIAVLLT